MGNQLSLGDLAYTREKVMGLIGKFMISIGLETEESIANASPPSSKELEEIQGFVDTLNNDLRKKLEKAPEVFELAGGYNHVYKSECCFDRAGGDVKFASARLVCIEEMPRLNEAASFETRWLAKKLQEHITKSDLSVSAFCRLHKIQNGLTFTKAVRIATKAGIDLSELQKLI